MEKIIQELVNTLTDDQFFLILSKTLDIYWIYLILGIFLIW
ncbi:hypothetical protein [Spiroplasma endosymbiont of Clivina fossor]